MRFIIADDHPLYLEAAQGQVTRRFADAEVRVATSVDGVLDLLSRAAADIVVLDYSMPGMMGTEGLLRVIAMAGEAPVVVMSGIANRQNVLDCIAAGAKGYIPKTLEGPMFVAAVTLVVGGATYVPSEFAMTAADASPGASGAAAMGDAFFSTQELVDATDAGRWRFQQGNGAVLQRARSHDQISSVAPLQAIAS
jgi:two-component system nitrate/nitrite response regulator NarL